MPDFEGALAALTGADSADAELAFDLSELGDGPYSERWQPDGTGEAAMTEEMSGCGSCNRTWTRSPSRASRAS